LSDSPKTERGKNGKEGKVGDGERTHLSHLKGNDLGEGLGNGGEVSEIGAEDSTFLLGDTKRINKAE